MSFAAAMCSMISCGTRGTAACNPMRRFVRSRKPGNGGNIAKCPPTDAKGSNGKTAAAAASAAGLQGNDEILPVVGITHWARDESIVTRIRLRLLRPPRSPRSPRSPRFNIPFLELVRAMGAARGLAIFGWRLVEGFAEHAAEVFGAGETGF